MQKTTNNTAGIVSSKYIRFVINATIDNIVDITIDNIKCKHEFRQSAKHDNDTSVALYIPSTIADPYKHIIQMKAMKSTNLRAEFIPSAVGATIVHINPNIILVSF